MTTKLAEAFGKSTDPSGLCSGAGRYGGQHGSPSVALHFKRGLPT
jgi:hypothetical protein